MCWKAYWHDQLRHDQISTHASILPVCFNNYLLYSKNLLLQSATCNSPYHLLHQVYKRGLRRLDEDVTKASVFRTDAFFPGTGQCSLPNVNPFLCGSSVYILTYTKKGRCELKKWKLELRHLYLTRFDHTGSRY